jgi:modulator of FtsH protease HflK
MQLDLSVLCLTSFFERFKPMNIPFRHFRFKDASLRTRTALKAIFNLNDPRWGRSDAPGQDNPNPSGSHPDASGSPQNGPEQNPSHRPQQHNNRPKSGGNPPDLDELWKDINDKIGKIFGQKRPGGPRHTPPGGPSSGGPSLPGKLGMGLIASAVGLIWLGSGFFIVQEGQQAVITQFGKYHNTVGAGVNWRLPWPMQRHEMVYVSQIRSVDIGRDTIVKATGLRESAMLTEDENIVEIKFAVQYRLSDARAFLFESKNPDDAVVQAAETAVREVVGKMKMDSALAEERDQIASRVRNLMQAILDRYNVGIEVVAINLQQGGVRPPEQVQAAFDDVLKAGQERERAKNEAQAYANDVVPRAVGAASRLIEEAQGYKSRIVAQAEGDAQRFRSILPEYQKAPQVTRDRMYLETMQQVYSNVTKVLVDSKQGSNLLYLPLDKLMQSSGVAGSVGDASNGLGSGNGAGVSSLPAPAGAPQLQDGRNRDSGRTRERDSR